MYDIVGYAPIEDSNWIMAMTIDKKGVLKDVRNLIIFLIMISIAILGVGGYVAYHLSSKISFS